MKTDDSMFQKKIFRNITSLMLLLGILILTMGCIKTPEPVESVKDANYYYNLGNQCLLPEAANPDKAIEYFNQAIVLDPKFANAYSSRGIAYSYKHEADKSIADYTQAITLEPKNALIYIDRASAYNNKDEYDKAIADCTQAIALEPKIQTSYHFRGHAFFHKGEYDKAIADYNQAIALDPKDVLAYKMREKAIEKVKLAQP